MRKTPTIATTGTLLATLLVAPPIDARADLDDPASSPAHPAVETMAPAEPAKRSRGWKPLDSRTTADIVAVEYQSKKRLWFATSDGRIFRKTGNTFEERFDSGGQVFSDIEFTKDGIVGLAVGSGGIYRSADAGVTWSLVPPPVGGDRESPDCAGPNEPLGSVDSVRFAGAGRAWIVAGGSQVFRTAPGDDVGRSWEYVNDNGDACKIDSDVDDLFPVPGGDTVYFVAKEFGAVYRSADALTSTAARQQASAGNGYSETRRLAGDPKNPSRQWSVAPSGAGPSYLARTSSGWNSSSTFSLVNASASQLRPAHDVDYAAGTVLAVGSGGMILQSLNGERFYLRHGPRALRTRGWRSVSLASGGRAAVGGTNGKLMVTARADKPPVRKPSRVRSLRVGGKPSAARVVRWRAPKSNGGARVTRYRVVVRKGGRILQAKSVRAPKRSYRLKRNRLRVGKHTVTVRARNSQGFGMARKTRFAVRRR